MNPLNTAPEMTSAKEMRRRMSELGIVKVVK